MEEEYDLGLIRPAKKIAIDLAGLSRKQIKQKARDLVNSSDGNDYVNPDNILEFDSDKKRAGKIFSRAAEKQYNRNVDYTNRQALKQEAVDAIKRGDSQGFANALSKQQSQVSTDIYNGVKTVADYMPGPVGTVSWLSTAGADLLSGNYGKAALSLGMGTGMFGLGKLIGAGLGNASIHSLPKGLRKAARQYNRTTGTKNGARVINETLNSAWNDATDNITRQEVFDSLSDEIKEAIFKSTGKDINTLTTEDLNNWVNNLDPASGKNSLLDYAKMKKNWKDNYSDLTTPTSYNNYTPATDEEMLKELAFMGKKEKQIMDIDHFNESSRDFERKIQAYQNAINNPTYAPVKSTYEQQLKLLQDQYTSFKDTYIPMDISNLKEFYSTDVLPRLLENLKKNGINLTDSEMQGIINMYNDPMKGVDVGFGYTMIGSGGYSKGPNFIRYPFKKGYTLPDESTIEHELHHSLRSRLGKYLAGIGKNKQAFGIYDDAAKEWNEIYSNLLSGEDNRNLGEFLAPEYFKSEYELMDGNLAMNKKFRADKSPWAETAAPISEMRLAAWNMFKNKYKRNPTVEELNKYIKSFRENDRLLNWARNFSYGRQIGSLERENADNLAEEAINRYTQILKARGINPEKPNLFSRIFYRDLLDTMPIKTSNFRRKVQKRYEKNFMKAIKRAMLEIPISTGAVAGANQLMNQEETTNQYKQGGFLKRK